MSKKRGAFLWLIVLAIILGASFEYYLAVGPSASSRSLRSATTDLAASPAPSGAMPLPGTSTSVGSNNLNSTSPVLTLDRATGPTGTAITISGGGYVPGVQYQVCIAAGENTTCGFEYTSAVYLTSIKQFAMVGAFTADQNGNIPPGTRIIVPDLFGGRYVVAVVTDLNGNNNFLISTPITVIQPTLTISSSNPIVTGANLTLSGSGYAPGITYTVCVVLEGTVDCGYTGDREETPPVRYLGTFTADQNGSIPSGTKVTMPALGFGGYEIGTFVPNTGYILISMAPFSFSGST
jgi:hypothetical protein